MRKLTVLILVLIVVSAGCVGGDTSQPQTSKADGETTSPQSPIKTGSEKENTPIDPVKALEEIKQYSYAEDASVELDMEMKSGNFTQEANFTMIIEEMGYVDFEEKKAKIMTTTTTLPDNVTFNMSLVVVDGKVYIKDIGERIAKNDTSFWRINPVSVARELLKLQPVGNYTENGTLVLVYSVPEELILPMAEFYFATPDMNTTVTDATAELYFTDEGFTGMKLTYGIIATTTAEDISGEIIEVTERGYWKGTIKITSINKKEEVEAPST